MAYKQKITNGKNGGEEERLGPPGVAELLAKVQRLLDEGQLQGALKAIESSRLKSDWIANASAVCLLRLGETERAVVILRRLCSASGGPTLRDDAPTPFKTNFATALLASGNIIGCQGVLMNIGDEQNETVQKLRSAIAQWKRGLSLWQKLKWYTGDVPDHPVVLDFAVGAIE